MSEENPIGQAVPSGGPLPRPAGEGPYADPAVRLVRLREAFAGRYPGLDAGAWYPAASVAAYFRSWLARHPAPADSALPMRGLEPAHFEFRGGVPREAPWLSGHSPDERQP